MDQSTRRPCISRLGTASLVLMATFAMGCGNGASPIAPGNALTPGSQTAASSAAVPPAANTGMAAAKIAVCHRTAGSKGFVPLAIAPAALDAHFAHGDARVGDLVPGGSGEIFGPDCVAKALAPVTVTFVGLQVNGAPVSAYAESGVDVAVTSGDWQAWTAYGNPAPMIVFWAPAGAPPTTGAITVSAAGNVFKFVSVDLYSSTTPIPYVFAGYLDSALVFTSNGTHPNTYGNLVTVSNPNAGMLIDRLVITLTNPPAPCCANPMGLDNITVMK